ncbi:MAG: sialidase family protein, partial [Bacteroidota bacterium]|nr:sialidase family protein [Bacteroidota bacterium]
MKTIKNILCLICLFTIVNLVYPQYPNRQVTSNPYDQSETMIAVNPVNNYQIVTVWNDYRSGGLFKPGYGISTDGGSTWIDDTLHICNDIPNYQYGFNPSVAMDRSGNIFYTFIAMGNDGRTASVVARKNISGGSWQYTKIQEIISEDDMVDKPWITVDNTGGQRDGYIYLTWAKLIGNYSTVLVARSADHGVTFSTPYELDTQPLISGSRLVLRPSQDTSTALRNGWVQMAMPAVGPSGEVYVVWAYSNSTCNYKISKSTNGGSSWFTPVNGPSFIGAFKFLGIYPYFRNVKIIPHPSLAVGSNGNLYLAYTDKRSSDQSFHIKFASSTDGGVSWSSPIIVGEESGWQYFACLTFNQSGRLSIGYMHCNYPESNDPQQRAKMATSDNGGLTWTYETISDPASVPPLISQSASYEYMGITSIANNNQVYQLWIDHRKGNADPYFISLVDVSSNLNAGWNMVSIPDTVRSPST